MVFAILLVAIYFLCKCRAAPAPAPSSPACVIGTCGPAPWADGIGAVDADKASFVMEASTRPNDRSYIEIQTADHQNHAESVPGASPPDKGFKLPMLFDKNNGAKWDPIGMTTGWLQLDVDGAMVGQGIQVFVHYELQPPSETKSVEPYKFLRAEYVEVQFRTDDQVLETWTIISSAFCETKDKESDGDKDKCATKKKMTDRCQMIQKDLGYESIAETNQYRCLRPLPKKPT